MPIEVKMPQLGESVHEGTVGKWLKAEGDYVERYEPLLEVITDKVDTEVTATESGTVHRLLVGEGETVKVGTVLALLLAEHESAPAEEAPPERPETQAAAPPETVMAEAPEEPAPAEEPVVEPAPWLEEMPEASTPRVSPVAERIAREHGLDVGEVYGTGPGGRVTKDDTLAYLQAREAPPVAPAESPPASPERSEVPPKFDAPLSGRAFLSPVVARLAAEHGVDVSRIQGTGRDGRVTRRDIERYVESGGAVAAVAPMPAPEMPIAPPALAPAGPAAPAELPPDAPPAPAPAAVPLGEVVSLTPMRRSIADHMARSKRSAPHVTTVHEVDMGNLIAARERLKDSFAARGINLTYTAFIANAVAAALRDHPMLNSSWEEEGIRVHREINLGIAVAIPQGLIVPVIRNADEKSLQGLAREINDLAERARSRRLTPDDVQNGTFTITNYGVLGSLFGTPIINQPQAAILGVGAIRKTVVVLEGPSGDSLAIRPVAFLSLSFDHRILDGAQADAFMQSLCASLQEWAE
jgi:2-oxoglutarate dehydrogenase E2 component (dihydrolipoamide succinyltransferase)